MNFYEQIKARSTYKRNVSATLLTGIHAGAKALWSLDQFVLATDCTSFFQKLTSQIPSISKNQLLYHEQEEVYIELLYSEPSIVICGAGHISMPIIKMSKMLGFEVTVIDDRPSFADQARAVHADIVYCEPFASALAKIDGNHNTYFVIVTRGHRYDTVCLEKIIEKENAYIGMIGSKVRVQKVKEELQAQGVTSTSLDAVYTPIGLDIKAETPEEISVAIMAEIIQVKNQEKRSVSYPKQLLSALTENENVSLPKAIACIVSRKGSAPRDVGTKMLVFVDGSCVGTIGGGCVEARVAADMRTCIARQEHKLLEVDMTGQDAEDDGMVCGGIVKIWIEYIEAT